MKIKLILVILSFLMTFNVLGNEGVRCQMIEYKEGYSHTLYSSKENGLHIKFPEVLVDAPNPNQDAWKDHTIPGTNHFWIRPDHDATLNTSVGVTAIGESGSSYSFVVINKKGVPNCAVVSRDFGYGKSNSNFSSSDPAYNKLEDQISKLNQLVTLNKQASLSVKKKVSMLKAPYSFKSSLIHSVLDDGRFTTVVLKNLEPGESSYVVTASIDGVEYPVDYDIDGVTNTYKLNGLFDEIYLVRNKEKIVIKRES